MFTGIKRHLIIFLIDPSFVWTNEFLSSDLGFMGPQVAAQVTKAKALSNNHHLYCYMHSGDLISYVLI
jgi:hypothetical protein